MPSGRTKIFPKVGVA